MTNVHKLGILKQQKCILSVLGTRSPKSRCRQGRLLPEASPSFGRVLAVLGVPWLADNTSSWYSLCVFSSYKDTCHWIGLSLNPG